MKRHFTLVFLGILATAVPFFQGCTTARYAGAGVSKPALIPDTEKTVPAIPQKGMFVEPNRPAPPPSNSSSAQGTMYPVWFGTNRKPIVTANGLVFTAERHHRTNYGRVDVFVPEAHRFGETGNPFWRRFLRGQFGDDNLVAQKPKTLKRDQFYEEIRQIIQTAVGDGNESQALVFIHGFNVSFEEAAIRAAQIGYDLKVPGPTAFFSWPSLGSVVPEAYRADGKMIKDSRAALVDFLVEFAQKSGAKNINLIAHSMGNRGLLESLEHIAADEQLRGSVKFNQIILAAPDINREVFLQAAQVYLQLSKRTTLYTSNSDRALFTAPVFDQPGARAGYFKPYTVADGVDTIAVPNFNVDQLGHSYFAQAEALLYDINDLLTNNRDPRHRQRVLPFEADGKQFWKLRR